MLVVRVNGVLEVEFLSLHDQIEANPLSIKLLPQKLYISCKGVHHLASVVQPVTGIVDWEQQGYGAQSAPKRINSHCAIDRKQIVMASLGRCCSPEIVARPCLC